MATLNLTFTTSVTLAALNNGLAVEWGYPVNVPDPANPGTMIPNPQSKANFNREQIGRIVREAYRNGERKQILLAAEATVPDTTVT